MEFWYVKSWNMAISNLYTWVTSLLMNIVITNPHCSANWSQKQNILINHTCSANSSESQNVIVKHNCSANFSLSQKSWLKHSFEVSGTSCDHTPVVRVSVDLSYTFTKSSHLLDSVCVHGWQVSYKTNCYIMWNVLPILTAHWIVHNRW